MNLTAPAPSSMTLDERHAEIAHILSIGYLRLQISRHSDQNELADCSPVMAPCDPPPRARVLNPQNSKDIT